MNLVRYIVLSFNFRVNHAAICGPYCNFNSKEPNNDRTCFDRYGVWMDTIRDHSGLRDLSSSSRCNRRSIGTAQHCFWGNLIAIETRGNAGSEEMTSGIFTCFYKNKSME